MEIEKFISQEETNKNGQPKIVYAVFGARAEGDAVEAVAKSRKIGLYNIIDKAKARMAIADGNDLWWGDDAPDKVMKRGRKCWAVTL